MKNKNNNDKRWELINILSAWKSGETKLILSDVVKYIDNEYVNKDKKKVNLPDFNFTSYKGTKNEK